jgi:hypothetical protein
LSGRSALRRAFPPRLAKIAVRGYLWRLPTAATDAVPDSAPLEIFLRVGPRDVPLVAETLERLRRFLTNPIAGVTVSTPASHRETLLRNLVGAEVIADEELIPEGIRAAIEAAAPEGRASWVTQQFLSMCFVSRTARHPCLVWDADTLMLRPHQMLQGKVAAVGLASEHVHAYFDLIRRLFGDLGLPEHSSTTVHHMTVAPDLLLEMFREIENRFETDWWRAILQNLDRTQSACMSDYEIFGQWVRQRHPNRTRLVGFRNMAFPRSQFTPGQLERLSQRPGLDSVSFHWWVRRPFRA